MTKRKTKGTPNETDIYVGARILKARGLIKMSQEKLADKIGITFQQIQKYERGMNRVSCGRLVDLAAALDQPITFFFPDEVLQTKEIIYNMTVKTLDEVNQELRNKLNEIERIAKC